jgi:ankyrin repeat protein
VVSILLSFASLNLTSGKLFFSQRASIFVNSDPSLLSILFILPIIGVIQFGYVSAWIFLAAYMKEYVFCCVAAILIVYSFVIKGLVLHWRPKQLGLENVILADEFLQHVSKKTMDVSHLYHTAIFTVLVSPFTVWCEPTLPLTKIQRKRSLAKLFLPVSNLFLITMLSLCICACATISNFQVDQKPPLSFCFPSENSTSTSAFVKVINSNWTSETRNMLNLCNTENCHPAIRVCKHGEHPIDLFATKICPFLIGLLILSFVLSLFLSYLSNYENLLDLSKCKLVHPVLLQKYLQNLTSKDTVGTKINQMINSSSPDILNFSDPLSGNTCLHAAFQGMADSNFNQDKIDILKQLVKDGANMRSENNKGETLHSLLSKIRSVLDKKSTGKCNIRDNRNRIDEHGLLGLLSEASNNQHTSKLMEFDLRKNSLSLMKLFFWLGGNLNARNDKNLTPLLSKLAEINNEETPKEKIQELTKMCVWILNMVGADQAKTDKEKEEVLNFVTKYPKQFNFKLRPEKLHSLLIYVGINYINGDINHETKLKNLIDMGCKITHPNIYNSENPELTLLHMSCDSGNFTATQFLVKEDAKINQRDSLGWTPLHYAVRKGDFNIVKFLTKKADVNITNLEGKTALHLAFQNWKLEIATHLIKTASVINVADQDGMTLLHYASKHQQDKIVQLLIEEKASIGKRDGKGKTPLHLVSENRSNYEPRNGVKCCNLLLAAANNKLKIVNFCDNSERTPLHDAVDTMSPDANIIKTLIENGANVNKLDVFGKKPLNHITERGISTALRKQISDLLKNTSAGGSTPFWYSWLTLSSSAKANIDIPYKRFYLAKAEEISHIESPEFIRKVNNKGRKVIEVVGIWWLFVRKNLGQNPPGKYSARIRIYIDQQTYIGPTTDTYKGLSMSVNKVLSDGSGNESTRITLRTENFPNNTWSDLAKGQYQGTQTIVADTTSPNWYFVYLDQFETDCNEELEFVLEDTNACWKGLMKLDCIDLLQDSRTPGIIQCRSLLGLRVLSVTVNKFFY